MSRIVVLGQVDCGKSTLLGHLAKQLSEQGQTLYLPYDAGEKRHGPEAWTALEQFGVRIGHASYRYAFAFDTNTERERGLTVHPNKIAYLLGSGITLLDTPGHRDYGRAQCIAASLADAALLVVTADAFDSELATYQKDSWCGGVDQACRLIRGFGIRRVIVAVNKLDAADCKDPAARFLQVQQAVKKHLARWRIGSGGDYSTSTHREFPFPFRVRIRTLLLVAVRLHITLPKDIKMLLGKALVDCEGFGKVSFIPVSAWQGANLTEQSRAYREAYAGPTLYDSLRALPYPDDPVLVKRELPRFQVLKYWFLREVGRVVMVHLQQGVIRRGMRCKVWFSNPGTAKKTLDFDVIDIYIKRVAAECAPAGSMATLLMKNMSGPVVGLRAGDTGGLESDDDLQPAFAFEALIFPEMHSVKLGSELHVNIHAARCAMRVVRILWSGKNHAAGQLSAPVKQPAQVVCEVRSQRGVCVAPLHYLPKMARFIWKQNSGATGIGHVTAVLSRTGPSKRSQADVVREVTEPKTKKDQ